MMGLARWAGWLSWCVGWHVVNGCSDCREGQRAAMWSGRTQPMGAGALSCRSTARPCHRQFCLRVESRAVDSNSSSILLKNTPARPPAPPIHPPIPRPSPPHSTVLVLSREDVRLTFLLATCRHDIAPSRP